MTLKQRLVLVCEMEGQDCTIEEARVRLDAFREAVQPAQEYGLTFYEVPELLPACNAAFTLLDSMKRSKEQVPSSTIYGLTAITSTLCALNSAIAKVEGR